MENIDEENDKIVFDKRTLACLDVVKYKSKLKWGEEQKITCPACGKTMTVFRSSYNGHFHAICETPNCFRLME